jgi:hypothetical protein
MIITMIITWSSPIFKLFFNFTIYTFLQFLKSYNNEMIITWSSPILSASSVARVKVSLTNSILKNDEASCMQAVAQRAVLLRRFVHEKI